MKQGFWSKQSVTSPSATMETAHGTGDGDTKRTVMAPVPNPGWDAPPPAEGGGRAPVLNQPSLEAGPNKDIQAVHDAVQQAAAWVQPLRQEMGREVTSLREEVIATRKEPLNKFDRLERKFTVVVDEFIGVRAEVRDTSNCVDALDDALAIKKN